jgi:hypothetical protein
MALDDKVLDTYFNRTKKPLVFVKKPNEDSSITNLNENFKSPRRFRVFDDPLKDSSLMIEDKNLGQNSDKLKTELRANLGQSSDKLKTEKSYFTQSSDKLKTELRTNPRTNLGQSSDKTQFFSTFSSLVGLQRKIILFIYENCKLCGDKITRPIAIEHLAKHCESTELSAQKTIQRLEKKLVIYRAEYKNGRSGWTKYGLPESIFQELIHNEAYEKLTLKLGQSSDKPKTELRTELRTSSPSSSSVINNKETTTSEQSENDSELFLSAEWEVINILPLANIGFSKHHLKQIASQNKLSISIVQESINAFAFDLKQNNKAKTLKTSPLNYLMGILRNGIPYSPPPNYESPEDRAMRTYLEQKRTLDQKRNAMEEELLQAEFSEWRSTLTHEQIDKILPEDVKNSTLAPAKTACLRTYFKTEIWPTKRQEIISLNIEINTAENIR